MPLTTLIYELRYIRLNNNYADDDNNKFSLFLSLSRCLHTRRGGGETKERAGYKCSLSSYRGSWFVCVFELDKVTGVGMFVQLLLGFARQLSYIISYLWVGL